MDRVRLWHLVWSAAVLCALVILALSGRPLPWQTGVALAIGAMPGLIGQFLAGSADDRARTALVWIWAVAGGAACALTGGVAGPLAAWCAAPLAAAVVADRRKSVSAAAALSVAALAVNLFVTLTGLTPRPSGWLQVWLSSLALTTVVAGLGAALLPSLRARAERAEDAEAALARLEQVLAEQPHLVMTLDAFGRVSSAYGSAPPGVPPAHLIERGLIAAAHASHRSAVQSALQRAMQFGEGEAGFVPHEALDRFAWVSLRRQADGRLIGVLRDATVQHARELQLEAAKAEADQLNQGKSRFLANMSHELRTPLNAVIGFSDIMRQRMFGDLPVKYADYAQAIWESGRHLLDLINDVLDMSKIEAERYELHKELFDAREPVSAALRLVRLQAHEAGVNLRGVLPPEPLEVVADKRALKQITLNLLSNALKFTPSGGSVIVSLAAYEGVLELLVSDTGVGIAPEDLARIGRPFEQAGDAEKKAMGTGLGLSLVRALSRLHGGDTEIESTVGEGTAVTVRMPVVKGADVIPLRAGG